MKKTLKKRGQKYFKRFSKASQKAGAESREHLRENFIDRLSHIKNIRLLIFEWFLLISALILLAITQAFWFTSSYADNVFTSGGTYIEATLGKVNSMNPLFATTNSEKVLSRLMFATLSTIDYSGNSGLGLAKSISADADGQIWTVKLRDGLKWSDGEPITVDDVIFTVNLIKNPAVNSIYDSNFANVSVSKNENNEIVFVLPLSYADFISALNIPILPEHILGDVNPKTLVESNFSFSPVTSGAFTFNALQTSTNENESIVYLTANPSFYKGKPLLANFAVHTFNSIAEITSAINSGSVTGTAELTSLNDSQIGTSQFISKNSSLSSGAFLFFNTSKAPLNNQEFRSAIRQGINVDEITSVTDNSLSIEYPILKNQIALNSYPDLPAYNPEAAQTTINSILNNEDRPLELVTVNSGYLPVVSEKIAESLRSLGLTVNVSVYDENQDFINNIISRRNYDLLVYAVELGSDPDPLAYYHSSQASATGFNLSNYRNTIVDDLLLGARETLDDSLRAKKYESFLEYWINDVPAIGLYQIDLTYYYNKNVRTFSDDVRLVTALDRFSDVESWSVQKTLKNRTP